MHGRVRVGGGREAQGAWRGAAAWERAAVGALKLSFDGAHGLRQHGGIEVLVGARDGEQEWAQIYLAEEPPIDNLL